MFQVDVNFGVVLVAAIVNMVVGWLWFGPIFGKQYMAIMGWGPEKMAEMKAQGMNKGMGKRYLAAFIGGLFTACVMYVLIAYANGFLQRSGAGEAIKVGITAWLGLIAPVTLGEVLWGTKTSKWWWFMNAYHVVALIIMSAVIGAWM